MARNVAKLRGSEHPPFRYFFQIRIRQPRKSDGERGNLLQGYENELIGLDKYKGGESEYLTAITYTKHWSGAISLFKATFEKTACNPYVKRLDLVAYIEGIPRQICRILQEIKPNRYELKRANSKLRCSMTGALPLARPAIVHGEREWTNVGSGWRRALKISHSDDNQFQEGLPATIPQMLAYLYIRNRLITDVSSTPVFSFEAPLTHLATETSEEDLREIRRGVKLLGPPTGFPHVGKNPRIAVLFPKDSEWAREQFFWA